MLARQTYSVVEFGKREVGRDLQQKRHGAAGALTRLKHARQQLIERARMLQVAQARRVRRRHVDGEIAGYRREGFDQPDVILDPVLRVLVGADIDPDNAATIGPLGQPCERRGRPLPVEAEPVDHALIGSEPENARPLVSGLRPRRHRSDFDEAEAEPQQRIGNRCVLVKARGNSDRIGKIAPKGMDAKRRIIGSSARNRGKPKRVDRKLVRVLRIDDAQQWKRQTVKKAEHGSPWTKSDRPYASR